MKITLTLPAISILLLCSCSAGKNEAQSVKTDSLEQAEDTLATLPVEQVSEEEEEENINDEDHGDPGLAGLIIDPVNLEPEVATFLSYLKRDDINKLVDNNEEILLMEPGPGVYPINSFRKTTDELLAINAVKLYLSSTTPATTYRMVHDVCQILEEFPEGFYISDLEYKDLSFSDADEEGQKKLQKFIADKQSDSGVDFLIKFRTATDELSFLHLYTIRKNGQLFITVMDQRECGA